MAVFLEYTVCNWNQTNDSAQYYGTSISASSVEDCQNACINNASCTGIDWNQNSTPHCWLSWYSGHSNMLGVTHYDIDRSSCHTRKYSFLGSILFIHKTYNDSNKRYNNSSLQRMSRHACKIIEWQAYVAE